MGQTHSITVEYGGDKVVTNAGSGSYYVGARVSWYPNLNGFVKSALRSYVQGSALEHADQRGQARGQHTEAGFAVTHWVTPVPIAVAGFNYGQYKKKTSSIGRYVLLLDFPMECF